MDGDFQQRYQQAEQAYAAARYDDAHAITLQLLAELIDAPGDPEAQAAVDGWRAFVALLLGNIELYGLNQPEAAAQHYQLVLSSQPHQTLADLARQGLEWIQTAATEPEPSKDGAAAAAKPKAAAPPTVPSQPLPALLRDPFLQGSTAESPTNDGLGESEAGSSMHRPTAMPWLEDLATDTSTDRAPEPQPTTAPTATDTDAEPTRTPNGVQPEQAPEEETHLAEAAASTAPVRPAEQTIEPEPTAALDPTPALESQTTADLEKEPSSEPETSQALIPEPEPEGEPEGEPEVDIDDPMDVLRDAWLRVTVTVPDAAPEAGHTPTTNKGDGMPSPSLLQRLRTLLNRSDRR